MRLQDYDTAVKTKAKVVSTERITPDSTDEVREIILDLETGIDLDVGQSVGVLAPGQAEFGQKEHFRLYTIADIPEKVAGGLRVKLCVRRCFYVDQFSGEKYPGRASNYLCDLLPGDTLTLTGPYGLAFEMPHDLDGSLILIGTGTGIAPFRAFVKHIHKNVPEWKGRILLFYGAKSGLDLLYMNNEKDDFTQYYDQDTFEAFKALSPRPAWGDAIDWEGAMDQRGDDLWKLLGDPKTYVYVAGLEPIRDELDKVFAKIAGGKEKWARRKAELEAGQRWVELLY